jgi:hypothetical protein
MLPHFLGQRGGGGTREEDGPAGERAQLHHGPVGEFQQEVGGAGEGSTERESHL